MKDTPISRRDFLKNMGIAGAGAFLAASPWLSAFSEVTNTSSEKCRLAIIGPGSRGRFLMSFLVKNPKVDIVALQRRNNLSGLGNRCNRRQSCLLRSSGHRPAGK